MVIAQEGTYAYSWAVKNGYIKIEEGAEGEEEDLSDLTMDAVPEVEFDPEGARELLEEAGWNLNENGDPYDAEAGGTRYLKAGENLIPLKLKMIYPEENASLPISSVIE